MLHVELSCSLSEFQIAENSYYSYWTSLHSADRKSDQTGAFQLYIHKVAAYISQYLLLHKSERTTPRPQIGHRHGIRKPLYKYTAGPGEMNSQNLHPCSYDLLSMPKMCGPA
jgi:hypothetical protein